MFTLKEKLNHFIYESRFRVIKLEQYLASVNTVFASVLLIWRYGFLPNGAETEAIFKYADISFSVFAICWFLRVFFQEKSPLYYWRSHWFESVLIGFLFVNGFLNLLFEIKLGTKFFEMLHSKDVSGNYRHVLSAFLLTLLGLEYTRLTTRLPNINIKPSTLFLLSFVFLILGGAFALMMPAMTSKDEGIKFIDALFISTSASCVTGLSTIDFAKDFTPKGHFVVMILAQIGGIGMITFATFFATFLTRGVGLKHQSIIQDHLSSDSLNSAKDLLRKVIVYTAVIETIGAICIFFTWDEYFWDRNHQFESLGQKIFFSVFHSISAFCNAGFSLYSGGMCDTEYSTHRMFNLHLVISLIIVLGGIGFTTLEDIFSWKRIKSRLIQPWRTYSIGSKIVLKATFWLIFVGMLGFFLLEFPLLRDRTIYEAFVTVFFQSVTTRTAGFNSLDFSILQDATLFLVIILMFIGAASGSTAGGLKITTFVLTVLGAISTIRLQERVMLYKRTISDETIRKAFAIFMFAIAYNAIAIFLLVIVESPAPDEKRFVLKIIFEQVSAFATVGLSMSYTSNLTFWGKVIIISSMYLGRVGTLTLAIALSNSVVSNSYRYPTTQIMVG